MALSCENHTAYLYDRGGLKKLAELGDLERVKWERRRDDTSTATVYIGTPGLDCRNALGLAEAGRVELVIFRGGERVWEGPISRIAYKGSSVEIEARDVTLYMVRTIMRHEYDNRNPNTSTVLERVERILRAELARKEALDPPINVLKHIQYIYVEGSRTFPASYYNTTSAKREIGDAKSIPAMEAALENMRSAYGLNLGLGLPPGTSFNGLTWSPARYQDWQLRQYMIMVANALAVYPPAFVDRAEINGIYFARNLGLGVGFNVGGAAASQRLYLDIVDYAAGAGMVFGSEHVIHHELCHLIENTFGSALIKARWLALNPPGFTYGGDWQAPHAGLNPPGFVRDYSRYAYGEDLAEVAGIVMSRGEGAFLDAVVAMDPVVRQKVALYKEWMASISNGLIDTSGFFRAVRTGKTVVTAGKDGATDARTAAHTLPYEVTAFEHVDNFAARGGLDYTVIGRSILFFDVHTRIGQTPMVTKDDFIGDPVITQYGMELGTYVAMTDGKGNFGAAGGTDPYYGEWEILHQAYDEDAQGSNPEDPPSVAEMTSQAQRTYKQGAVPPLVVRVPENTRLNPNGVLTIADLVPGVWIPLSATLPGRTVSQMQKLDSMTVEETAGTGEEIKVTLSPAYAEAYVEE